MVPAAVPSLVHKTGLKTPTVKNSLPLTFVRLAGLELPTPTLMSLTRAVPALVPSDTALCLFRVTQEALRNIARHAQARTVGVFVRALNDGLQLAITDDGVGFDPAAQRERPSLGLASIRERVLLLDGELDIESAPGSGTTIVVWVPVEKAKG